MNQKYISLLNVFNRKSIEILLRTYTATKQEMFSVYAFKRSIKKSLMTTLAEPFKNLRYHSNVKHIGCISDRERREEVQ